MGLKELACLAQVTKMVTGWDTCLRLRLGWRGKSSKEKEQLELQDNAGTRTNGYELAVKKM